MITQKKTGVVKPVKQTKKIAKFSYKIMAAVISLSIMLGTAASLWTLAKISQWFDQNRIVTHPIMEVKFNAPFSVEQRIAPVIEKTEEIEKEVPTSEVKGEKLSISSRGIDCVNKNPGLSGKMKQAYGDEFQMAAELICRESSFNPGAINPTSGACGLGQALPCSKMKCELSDVDCQIRWVESYVKNRYGTFEEAVKFHNENNWY